MLSNYCLLIINSCLIHFHIFYNSKDLRRIFPTIFITKKVCGILFCAYCPIFYFCFSVFLQLQKFVGNFLYFVGNFYIPKSKNSLYNNVVGSMES